MKIIKYIYIILFFILIRVIPGICGEVPGINGMFECEFAWLWILSVCLILFFIIAALLWNRRLLEEISRRKKAEELLRLESNRFRVAQDISLDAFTILKSIRNHEGKIIDFVWTYVNSEAGRILKQTPDYLTGKRLLEILPGNLENRQLFDRYVNIVETGQGNETELEYESEGISGWFRNMAVKLEDGIAISFSDITKRKNAEAVLKQSKEKLEQLVTERTAELRTVNKQLHQEIAERKLTEKGLKLFKTIAETSKEAIAISNHEGKLIYINPAHEKLFGRSLEDAIKCNFRDYYPPESADILNNEVVPALMRGESWEGILDVFDSSGRRFPLWERAGSILDENGNMTYGFGFMHDDTDRIQAENELRDSHNKLRQIIEQNPYPIKICDAAGTATMVNRAFLEMWGLPLADVCVGKYNVFYDPVIKELGLEEQIQQVFSGKQVYIPELYVPLELTRKNFQGTKSKTMVLELNMFPVFRESGELSNVVTIWKDITNRKNSEKQIRASLKEKEVLLREIHHRVKNNLTVIMGLIDMQAANIPDKSFARYFNEMRERIWAIALVHEDLYHSDSLSEINFRKYLKNLTHNMIGLYHLPYISLQTDFYEAFLHIETAIPCGLIYIELLTNALKHAFPKPYLDQTEKSDSQCLIRTEFREETGIFSLKVSDNGVGMPDNFDWRKAKSMGLRLVNILTKQLDGQIDAEICKGTEFKLIFPKKTEIK